MKFFVLILLMSSLISACGVKGRPLPPLKTPAIGRGKPTFSGRSDRISLDELNKKTESDDDSENSRRESSDD